MATFATVAKRFDKNFNTILNEVFSSSNVQKWILNIIETRLYDKGETGTSVVLKTDNSIGDSYSPRTMDVKSFFGQRIKNVTLKDKDDFYKSFRMALNLFGFELDADFQKKDGHIYDNFTNQFNSQKEFEESVMSLTDGEIITMIETMIIPDIKKKMHEIL